MNEFEPGEMVGVRAVREDLQATVVRQEGDLVVVRMTGSNQEVRVPAAVLYR